MLKHIREASYPLVSASLCQAHNCAIGRYRSLRVNVWLAFYLRLGDFVTLSGPALWAVAIAVASRYLLWFLGYIALFFATRVFLQFLQWRAPLRCTDCCLPASSLPLA